MTAIEDAMILCAGYGRRLEAVGREMGGAPKPLLPVGGRALMDHVFSRLREAGARRVAVNLHHEAERIAAHIAAHWEGAEIILSREAERPLDTGGGIQKAMDFCGGRSFFVCNCDALWEDGAALRRMAERFDEGSMDALLLLARKESAVGYEGAGDCVMDGAGRIAWTGGAAGDFYAGAQILSPRALEGEAREVFPIMDIWERSRRRGRLFGIHLEGAWIHAGTEEGYRAATANAPPVSFL